MICDDDADMVGWSSESDKVSRDLHGESETRQTGECFGTSFLHVEV